MIMKFILIILMFVWNSCYVMVVRRRANALQTLIPYFSIIFIKNFCSILTLTLNYCLLLTIFCRSDQCNESVCHFWRGFFWIRQWYYPKWKKIDFLCWQSMILTFHSVTENTSATPIGNRGYVLSTSIRCSFGACSECRLLTSYQSILSTWNSILR